MRVVLQRVTSARVSVGEETVAEIDRGLLILVGIGEDDDATTVARVARKCADLRVFADDQGRFAVSLLETGGAALVVSQFTLLADVRKGRRPSFVGAARPDVAQPLVAAFVTALATLGIPVAAGRFGASMRVALVNDGPVTIVIDSADLGRQRDAS